MEFDRGSLNARLYDRVCCAISSDGFTHLHAALRLYTYDATAAGIIIIIYTIIILLSLYYYLFRRRRRRRRLQTQKPGIHVYIIFCTILLYRIKLAPESRLP